MKNKFTACAVLITVSSLSYAQVWAEVGDAIDLIPGQTTIGGGSLDAITGTIDPSDADMFAIRITDFAAFSATTDNGLGSLSDTQLWLFNSSGFGIAHSDDAVGGVTLRSALSSTFVPGNGDYLLAITTWDNDALNAGLEIWLDTPFRSERAPDGPGAAGPVAAWDGAGSSIGTYQIDLTGAEFAAVPEPGSMIALGLGASALLARKRRKKA